MEKLTSFQFNNPYRLFQLAKKLNEQKFFEIFLNDSQFRILNFIISKNNIEIWSSFLDGSCFLKYLKDVEIEVEDLIEDGCKSVKMLALHIRYLLWEKAIDFYYNTKNLDQSLNDIEEVTDDYELIDELDKLPDNEEQNREDQDNEEQNIMKPIIREEEDDYDEDDEDEEPKKEQPKQSDDSDLEYNQDNQLILEIPISIFEDKQSAESEAANNSTNDLEPTKAPTAIEDQENLIKEFNKVYHNFEYDRETLIKRRKLEKSDLKLEENSNKVNESNDSNSNNMSINLGSASTSLQHLLNTIQQQRDEIPLNDFELRNLFMDVRKNRGKWANDERVGQEELYEACEKVVSELRSYTEHSTPFLNKVSKRDAPNYGLIIKIPMDLNTVMKKLKNFSYNSKQEFVDDVMLIWSNCLTYNVDPKHFLRAHAISMQKKTLKLIPSIPNITIRSRTEIEKEEELLENENKNGTPLAGKSSKKGRKRTKDDQVKTENESTVDSPEVPISFSETPHEALTTENTSIDQLEEEEEEEEDNDNNENNVEEQDDEFDPELQAWRALTAKSRANYCAQRSQLFDENFKLRLDAPAIIRESSEMNNFKHYLSNSQVISKNNNLLENDEPYLLEYDIPGGLPGFKYRGIDEEEEEKREKKLVDIYLQQQDHRSSQFALPTDSGLNKIYFDNITEIQEIRKICFKISLIRQMQTQQFVHHTQMKQPEIESIKEVDIDPVSKLSNHDPFNYDVQYSVLRRNIGKIAMQTGFETAEPIAINTLTQIAERYMSNLIKSIKLHSEKNSSNTLPTKEIILLSLLENGIEKPDDLYTFVKERVIKQQDKLKDLRVKLSNFLKELLRPGLENFNERSFEDNSEQFITGDFSNDLGDDFFGFKELGLDKEYNLLSSSIPIYLLHSRLHNSFTNSGSVNKRHKYEDFKEFESPRLTAADIEKQIGLLQPFYQKLLEKSKIIFIKNQKKKGEPTDLPENNQLLLIEDDELPQKQRNIRPRLPPTGKISSIKKKIIANSFFLPDEEEQSEPLNNLAKNEVDPVL